MPVHHDLKTISRRPTRLFAHERRALAVSTLSDYLNKTLSREHAEYAFIQTDFGERSGLAPLLPDIQPVPDELAVPFESTKMFLSIGEARTGLGFHQHAAAYNAVVSGSKWWVVVADRHFRWLEKQAAFSAGGAIQQRAMDPQRLLDWVGELRDDPGVFNCVQRKGTIVYVPPGHFHAVVNLEDDTIAVSYHVTTPVTDVESQGFTQGRHGVTDL